MGNPRYDPFRRHYKKDTRFLLDLYTLTYDEGENLQAANTYDSKVRSYLDQSLNTFTPSTKFPHLAIDFKCKVMRKFIFQLYFCDRNCQILRPDEG